jgi:hypothetical protein
MADQVITDEVTDTVIIGPPAHEFVNAVDDPAWRGGLIYTNSGDLNDPYKITRAGGHCTTNGDATDLQDNLGLGIWGFGCQVTAGNALADDFAFTDWYAIEQIVFYVYQTGVASPSLNRIDYAILGASPQGQGQPAWTTVNNPPVTFVNVYKKLLSQAPADPNGCTRQIQKVTVALNPPVILPAGQYWLAWRASGTGTSGPWQPPVVIPGATNKPGANGLQSAAGASFLPVVDGSYPQDFVFELYGTSAAPPPVGACCLITGVCVPDEPESRCVIIMGGVWQGAGTACDPNPCPPAQGACCFPSGSCAFTTQADCTGTWLGAGSDCDPNPCPPPGSNCQNPLIVNLVTPYTEINTTCGLVNDYSNTCLGSYDGGEDIIYALLVPAATCVDITVTGADPNNNWIGVLVDDICPPDPSACLYSGNSSSGHVAVLSNVSLAAGTYYLMIDTYPLPNCVQYTLTITDCPGACCLTDGTCVAGVTPSACVAQGGIFQGSGTDCGPWAYIAASCSNAFFDISATGTPVTLADDNGVQVPIGFTFNYFGLPKTQVALCSNGYLTFAPTGWNVHADVGLPGPALPNDMLAVLWDDLNCTDKPVHYQTFGFAPNRYFVAQWKNVPQYNSADSNTFQVFLYEADGCMELRYGAYATTDFHAGVENHAGTIGTDVTALVVPSACIAICGYPPPSPCPPTGACCLAGYTCELRTQAACLAAGGRYQGDYVPCDLPATCGCRGDCDCDGVVDFDDINPFVEALGGGTPCYFYNLDVDGSGVLDFDDINPFVDVLSGGSGQCP